MLILQLYAKTKQLAIVIIKTIYKAVKMIMAFHKVTCLSIALQSVTWLLLRAVITGDGVSM